MDVTDFSSAVDGWIAAGLSSIDVKILSIAKLVPGVGCGIIGKALDKSNVAIAKRIRTLKKYGFM